LATKPNVLIVSSQDWLGLSRLPATLHRASCRIHVFGPPGGAIYRARFVRHILAPAAVPQLIEALRAHLAQHPDTYQWVIFGDEPSLAEAAKRRQEQWLQRWLPVSPHGDALEVVTSKARFAEACLTAGLPFPRTRVCWNAAEVQAAAAEAGYPLMLKTPSGLSGWGVRKADAPDALEAAYQPWKDVRPLLVQEFLKGRVGTCEILYDRGQPLCWFASYLDKCWPGDYGPSTVRAVMTHPQMETLLQRLGRLTGFHGLCGIDWIHDLERDALTILEFNPRPTPCYHLGWFAQVDFAGSIRAWLKGTLLIQRPTPHRTGLPVVYLFPQHIIRCLGTDNLRDLVNWLPGLGSHDTPWSEPRLMIRHLRRITKLGLHYVVNRLTGRSNPAT
jgi:predicted ATP-grasp superfamily ATP-dependent carboligase